jgi:hypothetical protein
MAFITDSDQIILLNNARTTKALSERVKKTRSLIEDAQKAAQGAEDLITEEVIRLHALKSGFWKRFVQGSGLDKRVAQINDSRVKEIIEPTPDSVTAYEKYNKVARAFSFLSFYKLKVTLEIDEAKAQNVTDELDRKYPLITCLDPYKVTAVDHLVKYINMVHEETEAVA